MKDTMTGPTAYVPRFVDPASILVAIPTLNEARHIETTIGMLMKDAPAMAAVTIVVADGGSRDRTREIVEGLRARYPNLRLIDNPRRLQSAAVNRVVDDCAEAHHRVLVRVDAHAIYPPGYVLRVADSLVEHEAQALATVMDSIGGNCFQRGAAWVVDTKLGSGGSGHRGGTASGYVDHGHHAGFDLGFWQRTGGYDPDYRANEDAELDHRIGLAGGRIWLDAGIRLGYMMRPSLRGLARQYWNYGRGRARTVFRHRLRPRLRQMIPPIALVANLAGLLLALAVSGWFLLVPAAYLALCAGMSLKLALAHRSLCGLWAGPALFIMHMVWSAGFLWHALTRQERPA